MKPAYCNNQKGAGWKYKCVERMDEIAEKGYAAHYKYKNGATQEGGLMFG
jgi:hypothetical protein